MKGRIPKSPSERKGHSPGNITVLAAVRPRRKVPKPPPGLSNLAEERWKAFFRSPVAQTIDMDADYPLLLRYFTALSEWSIAQPVFQEERVVTGSMGQVTLNPLAKYIKDLEATMERIEERFGMGPLSRQRLGIAVGEARLTAARLVEHLNRPTAPSVPVSPERAAIEAEWKESV